MHAVNIFYTTEYRSSHKQFSIIPKYGWICINFSKFLGNFISTPPKPVLYNLNFSNFQLTKADQKHFPNYAEQCKSAERKKPSPIICDVMPFNHYKNDVNYFLTIVQFSSTDNLCEFSHTL